MRFMKPYLLTSEIPGLRIEDARYQYSRMQRGLMYYGNCSSEEVQRFCKQRKIEPVGGRRQNNFIIALEQADDIATFDRFEKLAPEIRLEIYKQFFSSFDTSRALPAKTSQPPISRVSRQTRRESLPLFYATMRFPFEYFVQDSRRSVNTATRTFLLLQKMKANATHIRRLELQIHLAWDPINTYKICIDLFEETCVVIKEPATFKTSAQTPRVQKVLEPILDEIVGRKGVKKLEKDDLKRLARAAVGGLQNRVVFDD